jgi:hypothetical protein
MRGVIFDAMGPLVIMLARRYVAGKAVLLDIGCGFHLHFFDDIRGRSISSVGGAACTGEDQ